MGRQERTCAGCGEKETQNIAIIAHNYNWTTTKAATCCSEGEKEGTCSMCGNKVTEKTAKAGHGWKDPEWTWSADNKTAKAKFVCKYDSSHTQTLTANTVYDSEPATCRTKGEAGYVAQVTIDGKKYSTYKVTQTIEKLSHKFGSWKTTAFDIKNGTSTQTRCCTACNTPESKTVKGAVTRIAGSNRFETAVEISKASFTKADTVVLAYGFSYADALAGVPLAAAFSAPILLTKKTSLPQATLDEIKRLKAKNVIILGGEGAVGANVEQTLKNNGLSVERIAGKTRFETAVKIAQRVEQKTGSKPSGVFFVNAFGYADALSASSAAAASGSVIIYLRSDGTLDSATEEYLKGISGADVNAYVIGGEGVVSDEIAKLAGTALGADSIRRIAGENRYKTCAQVNKQFADVLSGKAVCVAKGLDFPDALAGGVFAAMTRSPILLADGSVDDTYGELLGGRDLWKIYVFGGKSAVPDELLKSLYKYLD